jgi:uncharacterized membrane-anchored protein
MVLRTALRVVVIAVSTLFVGLAGILMGLEGFTGGAADVDGLVALAVLMRTVLVMALLMLLTWLFRLRDRKSADHAGRPSQQVLIAAGLAYFVNVSSWSGNMLFGQLLVPAGVFSAVFDLVVWLGVAVVGVRLAERAKVQVTAAAIPYA